MEQIIIFIILALVGSLFKSKKKNEPAKGPQPKPFTATGPAPDGPTSKLKEMYRELQREMAGEDPEPPSRKLQQQQQVQQPQQVAAPPALEVTQSTRATTERKERTDSSASRRIERPDSSVNRHSGRLSAHGGQRQAVSAIKSLDLLPKNQDDLLKGIVFSEIFGPPKSKR
jgi:hypothetical protein